MELDKRIKSLSDILTCFDIEKAKQFIGQNGYFAGDLYCFTDLQSCTYGTLTDACDDQAGPFHMREDNAYHQHFIPERSLKRAGGKYRPFDRVTFEQHYGIGSVIKYRNKGEKHLIYTALISAIIEGYSGEIYVQVGGNAYTFDELFERYEMREYGEWVPFGLKEK